jgi:predicted permease
VLVFAAAVSLLSGVLFGLAPVVRHAGPHLAPALRSGGRTASDSRQRHRTRNALVVQVGLALVLLIASGLMVRTFLALRAVDPGFVDGGRVQLVRVPIPPARIKAPHEVFRLQRQIHDRIRVLPVAAASFATAAPMEPFPSGNDPIFVEGRTYADGQFPPIRRFKFVAPGFFGTVGTRLLAGRDFTWTDLVQRRPVAIVSESMARQTWNQPERVIGQRIRENANGAWREIVGIVADVHDEGLHEPAVPTVYWPLLMEKFWNQAVHVRFSVTFAMRSHRAGEEGFVKDLQRVVWETDSTLPVTQVRTLADVYERSLARTSFTLVMLAIAGGMALLLGVVGIYGVIAYAITQRIREIGIRIALGAEAAALKRMFVGQGVALATIGVACGAVVAVAVTRVMSSLLFGIGPLDPVTYVSVAAALIACAAAASYAPASRAAAVNPVEALRAD